MKEVIRPAIILSMTLISIGMTLIFIISEESFTRFLIITFFTLSVGGYVMYLLLGKEERIIIHRLIGKVKLKIIHK